MQVDELTAERDDLERSLGELQQQLSHAEAALKAKEQEIEELQVVEPVCMWAYSVCLCVCHLEPLTWCLHPLTWICEFGSLPN